MGKRGGGCEQVAPMLWRDFREWLRSAAGFRSAGCLVFCEGFSGRMDEWTERRKGGKVEEKVD
jgi:hypothetical protein